MFVYLVKTYCDCNGPDCVFKNSRKTLVMIHTDPECDEEQTLVDKILDQCAPHLDEDGVIDFSIDASTTADLFQSVEGTFSMVASCHRILKLEQPDVEDPFTEESLKDVDLNI